MLRTSTIAPGTPSRRSRVDEALQATTVNPAWLAGDEHRRGKLLPGYLADLVVLDRDPFAIEPERAAGGPGRRDDGRRPLDAQRAAVGLSRRPRAAVRFERTIVEEASHGSPVAAAHPASTDRLRESSIGLPQVLFQSITHMAPGAAIAFSILFSMRFAGPALPLAVLLALIACLLVAVSIGQMAKKVPSAGGLYSYVTHGARPGSGLLRRR